VGRLRAKTAIKGLDSQKIGGATNEGRYELQKKKGKTKKGPIQPLGGGAKKRIGCNFLRSRKAIGRRDKKRERLTGRCWLPQRPRGGELSMEGE